MLLTQTAEYAVRAMVELARLAPGERVRAIDLSTTARVPAPYLAKVMAKLAKAGLVDGLKGHHGGFRLGREAVAITLADVLGTVDDWDAMDRRCFYGLDRCRADRPCPLHPTFDSLRESTKAWAASHTLAELAAAHEGRTS